MFCRIIDDDIKICLSVPQFADELFELTDRNREYLKTWLPWLDSVEYPDDTRKFIILQLERFSKGEAVHQTIFFRDKVAGVIAFNKIDQINSIGHIGYWLSEEFTGRGIMLKSVGDLINQGFIYWQLKRIEIRCAVENIKSRAIAQRSGFQQEGIIRRAEKVYEKYYDHVVYGLLKEEEMFCEPIVQADSVVK